MIIPSPGFHGVFVCNRTFTVYYRAASNEDYNRLFFDQAANGPGVVKKPI
jgi:hypothetical protein